MSEQREYCHNCGVAISEPSAFCSSCGTALTQPNAALAGAHAQPTDAHPSQSVQADSAQSDKPDPARTGKGSRSARGTAGATPSAEKRRPAGAHAKSASAGATATAGRKAGAKGPSSSATSANDTPAATAATQGAAATTPSHTQPDGTHAAAMAGTATYPGAVPPGMAPPPPDAPTAEDGQGSPSRRWIPFALVGGAAFVVIAAAVALLLALGGSAGKNVKSAAATRQQALALLAANGTTTVSRAAPGLYALVSANKLNVSVPAGWRATAQTAGATTRAEFADPGHAGSSLTVVSEKVRGGNPHARANSARKAASAHGDSIGSLATVTFPGGRVAWLLTYSAANLTHNTYFFAACNGSVAMVVDAAARPSVMQQQQTALEASAASAEPQC